MRKIEKQKKENEIKEECVREECLKKIQELQSRAEEYLNGWKRAQADYNNLKRDEEKRFETIIQFTNKAIIMELIKVLDSFSLAIKNTEKIDQGIVNIKAQLQDVLKRNGLEIIPVEVGKDIFNPVLHEAIGTVKGEEKNVHTIAEVIDQGYRLHNVVIRPVKVVLYQ